MTVHALVLDLDGTLADTEELHRSAFNEAFRRMTLGWQWPAALYRELLSVSGGAARIAAYIDRLREPAAEKVRLRRVIGPVHAEKTRIYCELLASGCGGLRPGVASLIEQALVAGQRIGLAASCAPEAARALLARVLGGRGGPPIAALACTDQVSRGKPAPDLYELLLASLRLPAAQCVAFEDSANGLAASKAAGLYTVVSPTEWTVEQDFSLADLFVPTLADAQVHLAELRLPGRRINAVR